MSAALHEIKTDNKVRFDSLENKVNSLEKSIKETVKEESDKMKKEIKGELSSDINQVKTDLAGDIAKLRAELTDEFDKQEAHDGPKIAHLRSENVNAQPPRRGPQELQGQNLYNLHRHPLGDAVCKISTLWCKQFQRTI